MAAVERYTILFRELRAHAKAVLDLDTRIADNHTRVESLVQAVMPSLLDEPGVGPVNAAVLLVYGHTRAASPPRPLSPAASA